MTMLVLSIVALVMVGSGMYVWFARKRLSVRTKVLALGLLVGMGATLAVGALSISQSTSALMEQRQQSLEAVRSSRQSQIADYFVFIHEQMKNFAQDRMIVEATAAFTGAYHQVEAQTQIPTQAGSDVERSIRGYFDGQFKPRLTEAGVNYRGADQYIPANSNGRILQAWYIANLDNSRHEVGSKLDLDRAVQDCDYNSCHETYHPLIRDYLQSFGFYDIFLFDTQGNLVYSVYKETDYATNFLDGPYRDTNFGGVVRRALAAGKGEMVLEDFKPYEPSYGSAASFIASPVFSDGERIGVAVFQMPVDKINGIMQQNAGMGESGETYLVASDRRMRSNSRFSEESTIFVQEVDTESVNMAIAGQHGTHVINDYRGVPVLSSYAPLTFHDSEGQPVAALENDLQYAVIAEIDESEVAAPAHTLAMQIGFAGLIVALFVGTGAILFAVGLTRPLQALVLRTKEIADGTLTGEPLPVKSQDEIGQVTQATNQMSEALREMVREMMAAAQNVAAAATEIAASSEEMSAGLDNQSRQITQISTAVEEMSSSAAEVAKKSINAADASNDAGRKADEGGQVVTQTINGMNAINESVSESSRSVRELGKLGEQIGEIIDVINDIADQTNLLALNAAIEAARAGEHGRGFAVVADEVRKLADRTTKATDEVTESITSIQRGTTEAVERMEAGTVQVREGVERATAAGSNLEGIVRSARDVSQMIQSIAAAAEQQSAASEQVTRSIAEIQSVAQEAGQGASQAAAAATDLSSKAEQMRTLVGRFAA